MNIEMLETARQRVECVPVLVNMISKRVRQLNAGFRPLVRPNPNEEPVDVCLREIVEGKLTAEIDFSEAAEASF